MRIVPRQVAIANLKNHIGRDLRELAKEYGITTFETGRQNKGWKGLTLERVAGLDNNSYRGPNGLAWELKSVSFYSVQGLLVPKETMAITMVNPQDLTDHAFFESHCWDKLKSMILCAVMWHGKDAQQAELLSVASFDFLETDDLIQEIKADYDLIRAKLLESGFSSLTGKDGQWMQARTKGAGHGSTSRAFYARKAMVAKIFEAAS